MNEHTLIAKHVREFAPTLGFLVVPDRPPEGDPEYGLGRYIEFRERGLAIVIDWDDVCSCVQLFSANKEPLYQQYAGLLLEGLTFDSSRNDVRGALGIPVHSCDEHAETPELIIYPWDWFEYQGQKIHFEYSEAVDSVRMVSVEPLPKHT